jgi:hypothetical protein
MVALHNVIQMAMGWSNSHPHYFADQRGQFYALARSGGVMRDGRTVTLDTVLRAVCERMRYVYDCGSAWEHTVELEGIGDTGNRVRRAACLAGKRRCPPEDCGGTACFADLLDSLTAGRGAKHSVWEGAVRSNESFRGWLQGPFRPDDFEMSPVNSGLCRLEV